METGSTGTYKYDYNLKKVVKVSDKVPSIKVIHDWMKQMNPEEEIRRANNAVNYKKLQEIYSKP